jgi:signal transduction histidine kinase
LKRDDQRVHLPRHLFAIRWWLGLAFGAVAALTAITVMSVQNDQSERAFHKYSEAIAVGRSVMVAEALQHDATVADLRRHAAALSLRLPVRFFAFDAHGRLLTQPTAFGVTWTNVPNRARAVQRVLSGNRYIHGRSDGSQFVVGLPLHHGAGAVLVTYSRQRGLTAALGIIRAEFLRTALLALAVGAALGLLVATPIARRLRRIANAARAIGAGDFTVRVSGRFPDEVGSLASSVERMRSQLETSFLTLERDRDRLERLLDRLNDGVLVVNRELEIEFANDRARDLLGVTGRLEGEALQTFALDLFAAGVPNDVRLTAAGHVLVVSGIPPGDGGESAVVVVHDQLQKERNEQVQREFATNAAHELRTPLASIVTAVEMLQTGAKYEADARDRFLDVIATEAARLTRLTQALLALARADAGDEVPRRGCVPVAPLLEQVASALRARPGVRIAVDCSRTLAIVGDSNLLEQAISSVASNAVQYTESGSVTIRGRDDNGSVVIEVADTGHGIPLGERGRVFERFYRTGDDREDGFGLGLSIARNAVGALGGEIALDSQVGIGTIVRITLERAEITE